MSTMSSPSVPRSPSDVSITSDYASEEEHQIGYTMARCFKHPNIKCIMCVTPNDILVTEVAMFSDETMAETVRNRSIPFEEIVKPFRKEPTEAVVKTSPLAFYIGKAQIRVEVGKSTCLCRHVFTVDKQNFYELIRNSQVLNLDIQVEQGGHEMFEFLAFTLPGLWCRQLQALNVVIHDTNCLEPLATLLKKSRTVSRLRIAHNTKKQLRVSDLIKNMGCLEELELNCPDNTGSGYVLEKSAMQLIVEQEKRTGAQKPFRSLKAFNTLFDFSAEEFMDECVNLSKLKHNQMYDDYETINEMMGRGGIDINAPGAAINFEVTPGIPVKLANQLISQIGCKSKSYLANFKLPCFRYFLIDDTLFRLLDRDE